MTTMMHRLPVTPKFTDGIKRSGMVESLRKPFEEQELLDAIHRVA